MFHAKTQRRKAGEDDIPENIIVREIVDSAYKIHMDLGPGLMESVYELLLTFELQRRGFQVQRQVSIPIRYEGIVFEEGFRADLIVDDLVIVEIKSVQDLNPAHKKQVLTYLRLRGLRLGILINFGDYVLKGNVHRIANGLPNSESPPSF